MLDPTHHLGPYSFVWYLYLVAAALQSFVCSQNLYLNNTNRTSPHFFDNLQNLYWIGKNYGLDLGDLTVYTAIDKDMLQKAVKFSK